MKKTKLLLTIATSALFISGTFAQCVTTAALGAATNANTIIRNDTKCLSVDKNLNSIVFIHRNDINIFGGTSGQLRYDLSTDGGTTWTNELGVLNPLTTMNGRYPQALIYNPTGNTNPNNAYLSYLAATIDATSVIWNGTVSGVRRLNGTGNTENYNQASAGSTLIPNSMCKGAQGVNWAIDAIWDGTVISGYQVYKGVWNGSSDFVWSTNTTITPSFSTTYDGAAHMGDYHIAFDPSGQKGWISVLTDLSTGPGLNSIYPVFYKTVNGGITWTGPIEVNLSNSANFPCLTANLNSGLLGIASTAYASDLTVDVNGDPHLMTCVSDGDGTYAIYIGGAWHHMYDITYKTSNSTWLANDIANINSTYSTGINGYNWDWHPTIARTADGTKLFFNWTDSDPNLFGIGVANDYPNLYSKGFNVSNNTWTNVREFTSCNPNTNNLIIYPKIAAEVLQPSNNQYKMAGVYTNLINGDPASEVNFSFLDNLIWNNSDFTLVANSAPPTVTATASTTTICAGSSITLTGTGNATTYTWQGTSPISITNGVPFIPTSTDTYTVTATNAGGCTATDVITVTVNPAPAVNAIASSTYVCLGSSVTLTTSGTATSYSWSGGVTTGVAFFPTTTTLYTLTGIGSGLCNSTDTVTVVVHSLPVVTASASASTVCSGNPVTLTGGGALFYNWSGGVTNGVPFIPFSTNIYTVTGTDNIGCSSTATTQVNVNPLPTITANYSTNTVCSGSPVVLTGGGGLTYSWSSGVTNGVPYYPTATNTYTVTGTDGAGCSASATTTVFVTPAPPITANSTSSSVCAGLPVTLTGGGGVSYTWSGGVTNGVSFFPASSATYTVTGTAGSGCTNTATITITVNTGPALMVTTADSVFCLNDASVTFLSLPSGGTWSGAGVSGNSFSPSVAGAGVHPAVYSYNAGGGGCTSTATINMTVYALPSVTANSTASAICAGSSVTLSGGGANSYSWTGSVTDAVSFIPSATNTYTVTGTDLNSCTNTASATVTVNPQPTITAQAGNQTVVAGTNVMYYVSSQAGATYQWQTNVGFGWQNLSNFGQYNGVNNDTLTISSVTLSNTNQPFQCIVTLGSCSSTSAIAYLYVNSSVGISEITAQQLSVYPNPASSTITVTVNPVLVGSIYTITDLLGNTVLSGKLQNETSEVNLDEVAAGMYMLNIAGNARHTVKVVKQ